jgi:hypothetical protein
LRHERTPAPGWKAEQLAFLKKSAKPQAVLVDMIVPPVEKLVEATK